MQTFDKNDGKKDFCKKDPSSLIKYNHMIDFMH